MYLKSIPVRASDAQMRRMVVRKAFGPSLAPRRPPLRRMPAVLAPLPKDTPHLRQRGIQSDKRHIASLDLQGVSMNELADGTPSDVTDRTMDSRRGSSGSIAFRIFYCCYNGNRSVCVDSAGGKCADTQLASSSTAEFDMASGCFSIRTRSSTQN
jgi:hypothetical protein